MKGAWRLGKLAGIDVYVHFTFVLLLLWVAFVHYRQQAHAGEALEGVFFVLVIFGIVVLHELGHALTARRFGIQTRQIVLLPIGGVAQLERMPDNPREELLVAVAGPAVNVALALLLFAVLLAVDPGTFVKPLEVNSPFLVRLMWANVTLASFNLLPAFPMDGGRMLRALLGFWLAPLKATRIAAGLGQAMAVLFFFAGLAFNPVLALIAFFIWMGASAEVSAAQTKEGVADVPVRAAMITNFQLVASDEPLRAVAKYILAGFQEDFPVVEEGRLVGMLTRNDLLKELAQGGEDRRVGEAMQTRFEVAAADEALELALRRLQGCECRSMPVFEGVEVVGLLTPENVGEFLLIRNALLQRKSALARG